MRPRLFLTILVITNLLFVAACALANTAVNREIQATAAIPSHQDQQKLGQPLALRRSQDVQGPKRCADATPDDERACATFERQILASTVRFEIAGPDIADHNQRSERMGHGTVKDGRYLVVHNHFTIDLAVFADERYADEAKISMYTGIGDLFVWEARPPL
jgi:hypothetical protein